MLSMMIFYSVPKDAESEILEIINIIYKNL
jgi:hypothetical protein